MKKRLGKFLPLLPVLAVCVAAALIGAAYFRIISRSIYEDSTGHLDEIYAQVNRSFGAFAETNWRLLESWKGGFETLGGDVEKIDEYLLSEKQNWGFSEFYFISQGGSLTTPGGAEESVGTGSEWAELFDGGENIIAGVTLSDGSAVTVFAVPCEGEYGGFGYDAVAVSYTNADLSSSLKVDAFSGKARCFVIHGDGKVLLSTQNGGSVYDNYLVYLNAASDLGAEEIEKIKKDWAEGNPGVMQCSVGGVDHCLLYEPVGYQDYMLLSVVPQNIISAGFLSVQKITMNVFFALFLLIGVTVVAVIIIRSSRQNRISRTELMYRERMFDVLSSSVDDIFVMLDAEELRIDYVSPNIERLLGIPVDSARKDVRVIEKCAVRQSVIPKDELESIPLNSSKHWECEYMHQTTGERRWYRMTIYNMSIQNVRKFISVMSDRTAEQQMNQKLTEALNAARSANEAKSNFLSNMSHDIRTPMNAIVGFTELLKRDADNPDKVREYTKKISASGQHLLSLINDVLDMSKIESGKTSLNTGRFSIAELLEEINIFVSPQTKAKNQTFRMFVQGAPPEFVIGDRLRLNQILINLLSNAVKYTPEGGKIEFTVSELQASAPQFVKLRFAVRDNGIGMSEEFLTKVFAPFSREINSVTNKVQGTGLGMAITKNLVDLMGGIISVESAPGQGSTFTVELSFALAEQEDHGTWFRGRVNKLLVADDEEEICLDIKELMKDTGVEVGFVTGGEEAVAEAERAYREGDGYSVILLDWKMPGVSGVEAARRIREKIGHEVPILVLTSYDWADIEEEARGAGINAFMQKPFFVSTFWQTIKPLFTDRTGEQSGDCRGADSAGTLDGRLFLIAEDNELNAEILSEMLAMEGAACDFAVNGLEALNKFKDSQPGTYDMILMDVQMPVMNGYEATREIRSCSHPEAKTIPIAAMTANTFAEDVRNALDAGMDGHLAKPIDMNAVRELCCRLLREKDGAEASGKEKGND